MKPALAAAIAAVGVLAATAGRAGADGFERLPEGAPIYVATRPVALLGTLQKLGVAELPAVQKLRKSAGAIDPFNPMILAAPGIDVAAPLVASIFEVVGGNLQHTRIVAVVRDRGSFSTFVMGLVASGNFKLASASTIKDAMAVGSPSPDVTLLLRSSGDEAILDVVATRDGGGKKAAAPSAAEVARRFPLRPVRAVALARGARRLFAPEAAAVIYVDGRKIVPLLDEVIHNSADVERRYAVPADKSALAARLRARQKACAAWQKAPALFDDLAVALTAAPDSATLTWAWGTAGGTPLGGLRLNPVDDATLDAAALAHDATGVVALYAAGTAPFAALKRSGVFASEPALTQAVEGCDTMAVALLALRSWPLALGTLLAAPSPAGSPLGVVKQSLGTLRNVVVALRDFSATGARFAVSGSFEGAARPMLELMLGATGATGAPATIGRRTPTVYPLQLPGLARAAAAAIEGLAGGRLGFTVADSEESLAWAFKAGGAATATAATATGAAKAPAAAPGALPILRFDADTATVARRTQSLGYGPDAQAIFELLGKLRHLDGTLTSDGDLLRLTVHAPLRP